MIDWTPSPFSQVLRQLGYDAVEELSLVSLCNLGEMGSLWAEGGWPKKRIVIVR